MKFLLTISLRNLFRQKRRNIMLGIAMSFGVMILIIANSFAHGVSDIMFNKIVTYVSGQVSITVKEGRGNDISVFRDKDRLLKIIKDNSTHVKSFDESMFVMSRAIGNGNTDNLGIVGIDMTKTYTKEQLAEFDESFLMVEGKFSDLNLKEYANPAIITKEKAELLNLKMHDTFNVRFSNIYRQTQSAKLTVVGIMSNSNIFMQGIVFTSIQNLKELTGYKEYESPSFTLTIDDAKKNAVEVADRLHKALTPGQAFIYCKAGVYAPNTEMTIIPIMQDDDSKKLVAGGFTLTAGKMDDVLVKDGFMISDKLAAKTGAYVGQKMQFSYKPKFLTQNETFTATVKAIFKSNETTGEYTAYMQEVNFYKQYTEFLPDQKLYEKQAFIPKNNSTFFNALGKEWVLLKRSATTEEWTRKMQEVSRKKIKATTIDVTSMYETASNILNLEYALNAITIGGVIVLFFIILIGVVNTLRMTIRERTREIGTIRAIGMQKNDVRSIFILETGLLAFFASIAGLISAFIIMGLMSLIKFNVLDNPLGILLVNKHLHFLPSISSILIIVTVITLLSVATAYMPARRASNLSSAEALRHVE
jgi:ABC-type lipoprotein release transport system permease subunit